VIEIVTTVGELTIQEKMIQRELALNYTKFDEFREREGVVFNKLREKYGSGNIDIDTGEVTE
jgi:hypothetical protein